MFSNQSTEFALEAPCRVVESIKADKLDNRFLVGSCQVVSSSASSSSARSSFENSSNSNHLYIMRFHSDVNELGMDVALPHAPGPIQAIAACPTDASLALTCTERSPQATLWKIPTIIDGYNIDEDDDRHHDDDTGGGGAGGSNHIKPLVTLLPPPLPASTSPSVTAQQQPDLVDVAWRDDGHEDVSSSSTMGDVVTLDKSGALTRWDISSSSATPVRTARSRANKPTSLRMTVAPPPRVAWDPHANYGDAVAVTRGQSVDILDWRVGGDSSTAVPVGTVASISSCAAAGGVIDLDYNPNKPYVLATSGQDGLLKFWYVQRKQKRTKPTNQVT
jgi:WD40 repeat protein